MGCDIHIYREKLIDGQWVTADTWGPRNSGHDEIGGGRNYALFYCLAGVRQNGNNHPFTFTPRGMPITASAEVLGECEQWHGNGYSHNFLYLHELEELLSVLKKNEVPAFHLVKGQLCEIIEGLKNAGGDNQRIVFWFDS